MFRFVLVEGRKNMTKEQYIAEIIELLKNCNDLELIELIYQISFKSIQQSI